MFSAQVFAQTSDSEVPPSFKLGLKVSPNFVWAKFRESPMENKSTRVGYSLGLMIDKNLGKNPNYWFSTELLYSSIPLNVKSTRMLSSDASSLRIEYNDVSVNYNLNYLHVPLTLKLKSNQLGNMFITGQLGGSAAILVSSLAKTKSNPTIYRSGESQQHSPNSSKNDKFDFNGAGENNERFIDDMFIPRLGLVFGLSTEMKISGKTYFSGGIRGDFGFTDIFSDKNIDGRSRMISLHLGVYL